MAKKVLAAAEAVERAWDVIKDSGRSAFNAVKDTGESGWYNTRCLAEYVFLDVDNVLEPDSYCQADVPHLLYFAKGKKPPKDQSVEAHGVSEMSCPKPYFFNTGPHRDMIWVTSYKGESYVMAIEEAKGVRKQNVFIGSFSPLWQKHLPNLSGEYVDKIVSAAVYSLRGIKLNPEYHDFDITVTDPYDLIEQGCTPSPKMQKL